MTAAGLGEWTVLRDIMARHDGESELIDEDGLATKEGQGAHSCFPVGLALSPIPQTVMRCHCAHRGPSGETVNNSDGGQRCNVD